MKRPRSSSTAFTRISHTPCSSLDSNTSANVAPPPCGTSGWEATHEILDSPRTDVNLAPLGGTGACGRTTTFSGGALRAPPAATGWTPRTLVTWMDDDAQARCRAGAVPAGRPWLRHPTRPGARGRRRGCRPADRPRPGALDPGGPEGR